MPGLTGDQFLARARDLSDATRILVTGYTDIDALIRAVNDGQIHAYVSKPWEPAQLRVTVFKAADHCRETLRRKQAAKRLAEQQAALARSEAALRQQTKLLQSILASMGDGVIVADENGKMVLLNPAAEAMVGPDALRDPSLGVERDDSASTIREPARSIPRPNCRCRARCAVRPRMGWSCTFVTRVSRAICSSASICVR